MSKKQSFTRHGSEESRDSNVMMLTYLESKIILKWQAKRPETKSEFDKLMKFGFLPKDIPMDPESYYKRNWKSWADFLTIDEI